MAERGEIYPFSHTGKFAIGTPMPGSLMLHAVLSVPADSSTVTGHGVLFQATSPPLQAKTAFHGVVHALGVGQAKQVYSLQGTAIPPLPGAPHVTQLLIALESIWGTKGAATYTYLTGDVFHEVKEVPVTIQWLLQD